MRAGCPRNDPGPFARGHASDWLPDDEVPARQVRNAPEVLAQRFAVAAKWDAWPGQNGERTGPAELELSLELAAFGLGPKGMHPNRHGVPAIGI